MHYYNLIYIAHLSWSQNANILHSFLERPKQRRHRCKDPSKLDVSSLTGEERVPVVHRNTGRRVTKTCIDTYIYSTFLFVCFISF